MTAPIDHVIVIIPAMDEATTIARALASVGRAADLIGPRVSADVVVAVDAHSRDGTARTARHALGTRGVVVEEPYGSVGRARRRATEVGLARARADRARTWLAATDADSVVPSDWLGLQLDLAADGAVAIAGIVELHEPPPALAHRFRTHYRLDRDGSHRHVHGANLGMRADVHVAAGGWRDLPSGEDHDLWHRVRAVAPVVHTTTVRVSTSPRLAGRAPAGFARDLRDLHHGRDPRDESDLESSA